MCLISYNCINEGPGGTCESRTKSLVLEVVLCTPTWEKMTLQTFNFVNDAIRRSLRYLLLCLCLGQVTSIRDKSHGIEVEVAGQCSSETDFGRLE